MHWRQMMESKYMGAWDLMDEEGNTRELVVTIARVEKGEVVSQQGKSRRPVVWFEGKDRPMVFNVGICNTVERLYGADPRKWTGKRVTLYVGEATRQGETVPALRVRPKVPAAAPNGGGRSAPPPARVPGAEG